jgi:hypothetical protein
VVSSWWPGSERFYDFLYGGNDKFRLVELDPMRAPGGDDMPGPRRSRCQLAMFRDLFGRLIPTRDYDHGDSWRWIQSGQGFPLALQHCQMLGHGVEALWLTPQFLNHRMNIRR